MPRGFDLIKTYASSSCSRYRPFWRFLWLDLEMLLGIYMACSASPAREGKWRNRLAKPHLDFKEVRISQTAIKYQLMRSMKSKTTRNQKKSLRKQLIGRSKCSTSWSSLDSWYVLPKTKNLTIGRMMTIKEIRISCTIRLNSSGGFPFFLTKMRDTITWRCQPSRQKFTHMKKPTSLTNKMRTIFVCLPFPITPELYWFHQYPPLFEML